MSENASLARLIKRTLATQLNSAVGSEKGRAAVRQRTIFLDNFRATLFFTLFSLPTHGLQIHDAIAVLF